MSDRYVPTPVGFARVNREPLDKYDTFTDLKNLIDYTKNGPAYDGQICTVSSKFTNNIIHYVINKTSKNNYKLTPLYNIDNHIVNTNNLDQFSLIEGFDISNDTDNIIINTIDSSKNKWLLIYSFNGTNDNNTFNNNHGLCDEYNKFSIMDTLELYRDKNNRFTFILAINNSISCVWYQYLNPISGYNSGDLSRFIIDDSQECSFTLNENTYNLFPNNDSNNSFSLYVSIDDYLDL